MPIKMFYYTNSDDEYGTVVNVYDISYDSNGFPLFLFYFKGQWVRKSAKHFKPVSQY